jgi:hypothetical protein
MWIRGHYFLAGSILFLDGVLAAIPLKMDS